ncbi:hypothetical protein, partial [Candidatus Phytoplasma sp. AldY-WA1]|uniref:hypothetical protein n=1 Tax=Candidatus Phytoplasma sp. AldY-WA1 TaxID=2852100 RepID=UPI00254A9682
FFIYHTTQTSNSCFFQKNSYFNFQYKTITQTQNARQNNKTNPIYATRVFQKPSCAITISQPPPPQKKITQRK